MALAERLEDLPPLEPLRCWMRANVEFLAAKKGMSAALAISEHASSNLKGYSLDRPGRAAEALRNRKVQSSGSYRLLLTF